MIINIRLLTLDLAGEVLRYISFTKNGTGCYSNFDLEDDFEEIASTNLPNIAARICLGDDIEDINNIPVFYSKEKNLMVFWYWDGDGTLGFIDGNRIIFNTDCKKDHDWQEILLD